MRDGAHPILIYRECTHRRRPRSDRDRHRRLVWQTPREKRLLLLLIPGGATQSAVMHLPPDHLHLVPSHRWNASRP